MGTAFWRDLAFGALVGLGAALALVATAWWLLDAAAWGLVTGSALIAAGSLWIVAARVGEEEE